MKFRHLFFAVLATGLFAACNNDDIVVDNVENLTGEEGHISLNLVLPSSTAPGTRAGQGKDNNDDFDAGTAAEYAVTEVRVLVFNGVTDASTLILDYNANPTWGPNSQTANITISSQNLGVQSVGSSGGLGVLVLANPGTFTPTITSGMTYGALNEAVTGTKDSFMGTNGFFMSNSPIKVGDNIQTLAPCTAYLTKDLAAGDPAIVYLERILGKVEVQPFTGEGTGFSGWTYTVPDNATTTNTKSDQVTFTAWGLDVTNKSTYPVRKVQTGWLTDANWNVTGVTSGNRFYGLAENPVRIYWAEDPNYTSATPATDFDRITECSNSLTGTAPYIDYCLENTFDVANQLQDRTTRIVMKAVYKFDGVTYDAETPNYTFYRSSKSIIYKNEQALKDDIARFLDLTEGEKTAGATYAKVTGFTKGSDAVGANILTITYQPMKKVGETEPEAVGTPVTIQNPEGGNPDARLAHIKTAIGTIDTYADGVCYYIARIKHFGEALTPWDATKPTYGDEADATRDFLGRYGVVRNNWYVLTINKADKGPGEPIVPVTPSNPDDEQQYYIDAKIHILSWAKRYQGVDW